MAEPVTGPVELSRFRKKPVVIDAVQFRPGENDDEMVAHLEGCTGWNMTDDGIVIPTLEGDHLAKPGDWIIKGVAGEFYPCKPEIFDATYEPVESRVKTLELTAAEARACENAVSFAGYDYFGDPAFVNALMAKLTEARRRGSDA